MVYMVHHMFLQFYKGSNMKAFLFLVLIFPIALFAQEEAPKYADLITSAIDFLMGVSKISPILGAIIGWLGIVSGSLTVLASLFILIGKVFEKLGKNFIWADKAKNFIDRLNIYIKFFSAYNVQKK